MRNKKITNVFLAFIGTLLASSACQTTKKPEAVSVQDGQKKFLTANDDRSLAPRKALQEMQNNLQRLKETKAKEPTDPRKLVQLARDFLAVNDLSQAEDFARKAIALDFRNPEPKVVLAHVVYLRGKFETSKAIIQNIQSQKYTSSDVENLKALIFIKEGNLKEARRGFEKSLSLDANHVASRMNLGIVLLEAGEPGKAQLQFEEALRRFPQHPDIKLHLGIAHAMQKNHGKAKDLYDDIEKTGTKSAMLIFNQAMLKKRMGDLRGALADLAEYKEHPQSHKINPQTLQSIIDRIQERLIALESQQDDDGEKLADESLAPKNDSSPTKSSAPSEQGPKEGTYAH